MLLPDPRLQTLRVAWSPEEMTRLLGESVLLRLCPGAVVAELAISSITYRPGRTCVVLYTLHLEGKAEPVWLLATFGKPGRLERAFQKHYAGIEPPRAVLLVEHGCLIELFSADYELPSLPAALDAGVIAGELSLPGAAVEVLHYVPHRRCLLRYAAGESELVGKLYPPGDGASRAWELLRKLEAAQPDTASRVTPAPAAFLAERDLVLMERATGIPLHHVLAAAPTAEARTAVGVAAATLASLHALDVTVTEERSIERELAHTRKRNDRMRLVEPELAGAVDAMLNTVEERLRGEPPGPSCFVHGDYKASQLLVEDGRAVAVDFDRAAHGDPALDVGNFLADLHRQAIVTGRDGLRDLGAAFLESYCPRADVPGLVERARLAQIVVLARMAVRALRHAPHEYIASPATSLSACLLREAEECSERR